MKFKNSNYLESYYRRRNILYFEKEHYGLSILKNLSKRVGLTQIIKFFIKNLFVNSEKNELYYLNIANIHALMGITGKLKF